MNPDPSTDTWSPDRHERPVATVAGQGSVFGRWTHPEGLVLLCQVRTGDVVRANADQRSVYAMLQA